MLTLLKATFVTGGIHPIFLSKLCICLYDIPRRGYTRTSPGSRWNSPDIAHELASYFSLEITLNNMSNIGTEHEPRIGTVLCRKNKRGTWILSNFGGDFLFPCPCQRQWSKWSSNLDSMWCNLPDLLTTFEVWHFWSRQMKLNTFHTAV